MFHWSYFSCAFDNRPKAVECSWEDFCKVVTCPIYAPEITEGCNLKYLKTLGPAWSAACWHEGYLRGVAGIKHAQILALDVDNSQKVIVDYNDKGGPIVKELICENSAWPEEIRDHLADRDVQSLIYTSFSNQPNWPKFRVVIPCSQQIAPENYKYALEHMLKDLGLNKWRHCCDIKAMRETSRMYFNKAKGPATEAQSWNIEGNYYTLPDPIPTNITLTNLLQPTLTEEAAQKRLLIQATQSVSKKFKELKITDQDQWWRSLPFDLHALDLVGQMKEMGFHVGEPVPWQGENVGPDGKREVGQRYVCECPFACEHSDYDDNPNSRYQAYIIQFPYSIPVMKCFHTGSHGDELLRLFFTEPNRINDAGSE